MRTDRRKDRIKSVLNKRQVDFTVVLENINDPHNLSACLRSCDAVGISKVHIIYHSGQPKPFLGNSSSASAKKWINSEYYDSVEECFDTLRKNNFKIFTTHLSSDAASLYDLEFDNKIALVFGNEHSGVSEKALELADGNFLIPQFGMIQSLNISVACAVSVFEGMRQKLKLGHYEGNSLPDEIYKSEYEKWLKK